MEGRRISADLPIAEAVALPADAREMVAAAAALPGGSHVVSSPIELALARPAHSPTIAEPRGISGHIGGGVQQWQQGQPLAPLQELEA